MTWWWGDDDDFGSVAEDGNAVGDEAEEVFEEVGEGGEVVHPAAPEGRQGGEGDDAVEGDDEEEEHGHEEGGEQFVEGEAGDHLSETDVVHLEGDYENPHAGRDVRVAGEAWIDEKVR